MRILLVSLTIVSMKKILITMLSVLFVVVVFAQDQTVKDLQSEAGKEIKKDPNDTIPKVIKQEVYLL